MPKLPSFSAISRRQFITGALAALLMPGLPEKRFWPGWRPPWPSTKQLCFDVPVTVHGGIGGGVLKLKDFNRSIEQMWRMGLDYPRTMIVSSEMRARLGSLAAGLPIRVNPFVPKDTIFLMSDQDVAMLKNIGHAFPDSDA